jgi:hypothetical protein
MTAPRTPRVIYSEAMPAEVVAAVRPHLDAWLVLLPTWVHVVRVGWDDAPDDKHGGTTAATMSCLPEYREVLLTVTSFWLSMDDAHRATLIRHELLHPASWTMLQAFNDAIVIVRRKNQDLAKLLEEKFRVAEESAIQDLAYMVAALAAQPLQLHVHQFDPARPDDVDRLRDGIQGAQP